MAFRIEKGTCAIVIGALLLSHTLFGQEPYRYEAWHGHSRPPHIKRAGNSGTLTITAAGVSFAERYRKGDTPRRPHSWEWKYDDIQQLTISPKSLKVLTYKDNKWKLGADREYQFDLTPDRTFEDAWGYLRTRLDQRLVAAIASTPARVLWEIPAKHLARFGGDQGMLQIGEAEIVYRSEDKNGSRTWRYEDIENVGSAGPFELSITTFERAKSEYGSLRSFNFQLKQKLPEARYDELWLRLNRARGLNILGLYQ